jgi:HD-GYP domain-containing protein (c-di-GMP phosphodiesterase class II)
MVETQSLLGKITALRQRLEQAQGLAKEAGSAAVALLGDQTGPPEHVLSLEQQAVVGGEHDAHLDLMVRPLTAALSADRRPLPRQLTARARRLLERGRDLLGRLRALADAFAPATGPSLSVVPAPDVPLLERSEPLTMLYRETVSMTDVGVRMVPLFPDTATAQLQMCDGLEGVLNTVAARVRILEAGVHRHRREHECVALLGEMFTAALAGERRGQKAILDLAEEVLADATDGGPLRFAPADPSYPARFAAGHGISTARVVARLVRHDAEWRHRPHDAVLAALVHDSGMARVPPELLTHAGPLDDEQRRTVEGHCQAAVELVNTLWPDSAWLASAVGGHHERLDGSGYPGGLRDSQITPLARLLAVADVFVAQCTTRPHRAALETRTALTDTLLLAEQSLLDRTSAELLLQLSFYPVGTAVELSNGAIGVVVATASAWRDLSAPARPVVALLLDGDGNALPSPRHLDLMQCEHHNVVRSLAPPERRELLGARFPEWV